jgi:hypothetical protein
MHWNVDAARLKYAPAVTLALLALLITSAQAETTVQCGPVTLTLKRDKEGKVQIIASTGLPYGTYEIVSKDGEIYIGGHMCKPICDTAVERRC